MWVYDRIIFKFKKDSELLSKLNELGSNGWEIISYEENRPTRFDADKECVILMKKKEGDNRTVL